MNHFHWYFVGISLLLITGFFSQCHTIIQPDEYYSSIQSGEPTQTSVILLARLQKSDSLVNNDLQGIEGFIKFRITRDVETKSFMESNFYYVSESTDYNAKHEFTGLRPGQKYFYSISYGRDTSNNTTSSWNSFKTLYLPSGDKNISFVITGRINYQAFIIDKAADKVQAASAAWSKTGFPAFHSISLCNPDFRIGNGDDVCSDEQQELPKSSQEEVRKQWHWLFSLSEFNKMQSRIPCFWIFSENVQGGIFSAEQVPVLSCTSENKSSFRTYRLNRDVQIWLFESSGHCPQVSGKSKRGTEQITWLKTTLKESNAPFKLIISPVSLLNPENNSNTGNQATIDEFRAEKDSLNTWLKNNGFRNNDLYFICSNPRWQYHSIDPVGFEEFSCGALDDSGFRQNISTSDPLLTIPMDTTALPYFQKGPSGGFLFINSGRDEFNSPVLLFRFFDEHKKLLYAVNKY